ILCQGGRDYRANFQGSRANLARIAQIGLESSKNLSLDPRKPRHSEAAMKLDAYDLKILDLLQHDGGLSNQEIAERIGLSPSPCSRRIKQLEEAGVIRERVARLSPQALGLDLTVLLHIRMDRHTPERFEQFEKVV